MISMGIFWECKSVDYPTIYTSYVLTHSTQINLNHNLALIVKQLPKTI